MKELIDCRYMSISRFQLEKGRNAKHSLFFITSGGIEFQIGGVKNTATEGMLVSFPNDVTFERRVSEHVEFYYFRYKNTDGHPLPVGKISVENTARMIATADMLLKLEGMAGHERLKNMLLTDIFMQVEAEKALASLASDTSVAIVHSYMEKHLHEKISLATLSERAFLSPTGLIQHFKKHTGKTPMAYLTAMRLAKAQMFLSSTDKPISRIAALCGFDNPYYFSNAFKKENGISPSEYRKKYKI